MMAGRGRSTRRYSGGEGFALIEVLVAFTVLALITVVIQRGIVSATAATARAEDRLEAAIVARSLMTISLGAGPDSLSPRTGTMNGHAWRIRFEKLHTHLPLAPAADAGHAQWQPLRMIVSVATEKTGRQALSVETIRLVRVAP